MENLVVGLLAHVDAGKTTLAESLLYNAGTIRKIGRVDHGDAYLDTNRMEKDRGITIFSKQARLCFDGMDITMLDTPGHVDFSSEMERTLSVLDLAILVVSGSEGVQGHTSTLWKLLEHYDVPTVIFVNKMDQPGTDKKAILEDIKKKLSKSCVDMTDDDEAVMENISATDEELIEEYLESGELSVDSIKGALCERKVFPVWYGSALKNEGVTELLSGIVKYAPEQEYGEEFGARVFKITRDDQGKRLTHVKIIGGKLLPRTVIDYGEEETEKVDQLRLYNGVKFETTSEARAGSIVAITGLTKTYAGQGLGASQNKVLPVLEPVLSYKLELPEGSDAMLLYGKLSVLQEEYPELNFSWNERHKEIHVSVNGEIQTQILKQIMKERFDIEVGFGAGSIVYKETISEPAYGIGHFEPLRHYAEVQLILQPGEPGSGIEFASLCSVDELDKNWQRLIATHVEERIHPGVLTRSETIDLRVLLVTGRAHPKHTMGGDFRQATYRAIRNALEQARAAGKAVLMEPIYKFTMDLPAQFIGRAMTDVERAHGKVGEPELSEDGTVCTLRGTAPVSTFWEYQKELTAYTGGFGHLTCFLMGYAPCHNQEEVVQAIGYESEADERNSAGSVFCAHGAGFNVPWQEVAGYAHMPCPIKAEEGAMIAGFPGADMGLYKDESDSTFGAPADKNASSGQEEKWISIDEIDAIFAAQFKNRKAGAAANRKIYKKRHEEKVYVSDYKSAEAVAEKRTTAKLLPKCLLVDGYNMIHAWKELKPLIETNMDGARGRLIDICSEYQGIVGGELILVFDAYLVSGGVGSVTRQGGIYVVYTKEAETADQYIEQATKRKAGDYRVTVATSDLIEQLIVWGDGALRMSAPEFEAEIERARNQLRNDYLDKHGRLGNALPLDNIKL